MLIGNALEGQFLFYAGRNQEAEVRFRKTLDLEPSYWVAHNGLGRVYLLRKMFSEATAAFTTASALAPESLNQSHSWVTRLRDGESATKLDPRFVSIARRVGLE